MDEFIHIGTLGGAILGGLHFLQILSSRLSLRGISKIGTVWYAVWNWAFWTVFGAYILALWIVGGAVYLVVGRAPGRSGGK